MCPNCIAKGVSGTQYRSPTQLATKQFEHFRARLFEMHCEPDFPRPDATTIANSILQWVCPVEIEEILRQLQGHKISSKGFVSFLIKIDRSVHKKKLIFVKILN